MKTKKAKIIILSVLTVIAILAYTGRYLYQKHKEEQHHAEMQAMFEQRSDAYLKLFPEKFPELCGELPLEGYASASVSINNENKNNQYYVYTFEHALTLITDESFDRYSDRSKYKRLKEWNHCAFTALYSFEETYLGDYEACMKEVRNLYDLPMHYGLSADYYIKTPEHTYQYASMISDYFLLDGRDHYVRYKKSNQSQSDPTPASSWKPSWDKHISDDDYYDAEDYIDADDFASDWEDSGDFEDYDDAHDYYEEVMGHD